MAKVRKQPDIEGANEVPFKLVFHDRIPEGVKGTHWDTYRMLSRFGKGVTLWFSGNEDERESVILHHHESRTRWRLVWGKDNEPNGDFMNMIVKAGQMGAFD